VDSENQKLVRINPSEIPEDVLERAVALLKAGKLIVIPTETVYGLAGDLEIPGVLESIYRAKGRPESKPIPLFAADLSWLEKAGAELSSGAKALAKRFWPGALTLVLNVRGEFKGYRIPDYPISLALLKKAGRILGVTSANRSGEPPAETAETALKALGDSVGMILDAGPSPGGVPSTVVKVHEDKVEILREGAIPREEIVRVYSETYSR
jgi:L-threonylcarbamoyladenylate synthase